MVCVPLPSCVKKLSIEKLQEDINKLCIINSMKVSKASPLVDVDKSI